MSLQHNPGFIRACIRFISTKLYNRKVSIGPFEFMCWGFASLEQSQHHQHGPWQQVRCPAIEQTNKQENQNNPQDLFAMGSPAEVAFDPFHFAVQPADPSNLLPSDFSTTPKSKNLHLSGLSLSDVLERPTSSSNNPNIPAIGGPSDDISRGSSSKKFLVSEKAEAESIFGQAFGADEHDHDRGFDRTESDGSRSLDDDIDSFMEVVASKGGDHPTTTGSITTHATTASPCEPESPATSNTTKLMGDAPRFFSSSSSQHTRQTKDSSADEMTAGSSNNNNNNNHHNNHNAAAFDPFQEESSTPSSNFFTIHPPSETGGFEKKEGSSRGLVRSISMRRQRMVPLVTATAPAAAGASSSATGSSSSSSRPTLLGDSSSHDRSGSLRRQRSFMIPNPSRSNSERSTRSIHSSCSQIMVDFSTTRSMLGDLSPEQAGRSMQHISLDDFDTDDKQGDEDDDDAAALNQIEAMNQRHREKLHRSTTEGFSGWDTDNNTSTTTTTTITSHNSSSRGKSPMRMRENISARTRSFQTTAQQQQRLSSSSSPSRSPTRSSSEPVVKRERTSGGPLKSRVVSPSRRRSNGSYDGSDDGSEHLRSPNRGPQQQQQQQPSNLGRILQSSKTSEQSSDHHHQFGSNHSATLSEVEAMNERHASRARQMRNASRTRPPQRQESFRVRRKESRSPTRTSSPLRRSMDSTDTSATAATSEEGSKSCTKPARTPSVDGGYSSSASEDTRSRSPRRRKAERRKRNPSTTTNTTTGGSSTTPSTPVAACSSSSSSNNNNQNSNSNNNNNQNSNTTQDAGLTREGLVNQSEEGSLVIDDQLAQRFVAELLARKTREKTAQLLAAQAESAKSPRPNNKASVRTTPDHSPRPAKASESNNINNNNNNTNNNSNSKALVDGKSPKSVKDSVSAALFKESGKSPKPVKEPVSVVKDSASAAVKDSSSGGTGPSSNGGGTPSAGAKRNKNAFLKDFLRAVKSGDPEAEADHVRIICPVISRKLNSKHGMSWGEDQIMRMGLARVVKQIAQDCATNGTVEETSDKQMVEEIIQNMLKIHNESHQQQTTTATEGGGKNDKPTTASAGSSLADGSQPTISRRRRPANASAKWKNHSFSEFGSPSAAVLGLSGDNSLLAPKRKEPNHHMSSSDMDFAVEAGIPDMRVRESSVRDRTLVRTNSSRFRSSSKDGIPETATSSKPHGSIRSSGRSRSPEKRNKAMSFTSTK